MMEDRRELLRKIPKIDEVLQDERLFFYGKYAQSSDCGIGQGSHPGAEEGYPGRQKESGGYQGNTDDRNRGPHYRQEEKEPAARHQCNRGGASHQPGKGKSIGQGMREHHGRSQELYQSGI